MDHENTITLDAFLTALSRLGDPLPVELKKQLNAIAQGFPDTIRKLPGLVDQYAPLEEQYEIALDAMPSDGERLKFAEPQTVASPIAEAESPQDPELPESTVSWDEVERQVGWYFKEMALDVIERSHPNYDPKMTEVLTAALTEMKQTPAMTIEQFDDWLTTVFDSPDDEL